MVSFHFSSVTHGSSSPGERLGRPRQQHVAGDASLAGAQTFPTAHHSGANQSQTEIERNRVSMATAAREKCVQLNAKTYHYSSPTTS
jgi:hypothetical protein